jgi:uncharacterized protein YndB with AHSA1/START domain
MTTTTPLEIEAPPGEAFLHTRRFVRATPELVYDAWTRPEHIRRWLGPRGLTMTVCESDLRVGGEWRFVHRGPDGVGYWTSASDERGLRLQARNDAATYGN